MTATTPKTDAPKLAWGVLVCNSRDVLSLYSFATQQEQGAFFEQQVRRSPEGFAYLLNQGMAGAAAEFDVLVGAKT